MKSSDLFINNKYQTRNREDVKVTGKFITVSAFHESVMIHDNKLAIVHVYNKITPMSSYNKQFGFVCIFPLSIKKYTDIRVHLSQNAE